MNSEFENAKRMVLECVKTGTPILLKGGVGIGKTELVNEIGVELGKEVLAIHLGRYQGTDFVLPIVDEGKYKHLVSDKLRQLTKGNMILFIDEYDRGSGDTRNAILSLLNERIFEDIKIPDSVAIIGAVNQETSRDTNMLNQAEQTRFFTLDLDEITRGLDVESDYLRSWIQYAVNKETDSKIISFISAYPELLNKPSEDEAKFPCPRGWITLGKNMETYNVLTTKMSKARFVKGFIGNEGAEKFTAFVEVYSKMPTAEEILKGKYKPTTINEQVASVDIVVQHLRKNTKDIKAGVKFFESLGGELFFVSILRMKMDTKEGLPTQLLKVAEDNASVKKVLMKLASERLNF